MWIFQFFIRKRARAASNARTYLSCSSPARERSKLSSFSKVESFLLASYATDNIFVEADKDMKNFNQPTGKDTFEYTYALWNETLCSWPVYD